MNERVLYIEVEGIDMYDLPYGESYENEDMAEDIAGDICHLLQVEYDLPVEGVSCVVNQKTHSLFE